MKAKIVLAGAPRVGKTSTVRRFVLNEFDERYKETLGAIVYKRTIDVAVTEGTVRVVATVWDLVGRTGEHDPFQDVDLYGAHGVLAVCDVTNLETVEPLRRRVGAALKAAGHVPMLILLNKADLGPKPEVLEKAAQIALDHGVPCYLTSAKRGDNVVEAFEDLARQILVQGMIGADRPFDGVDRSILMSSSVIPLTATQIAGAERIDILLAEARVERLRRGGYLRISSLDLDADGRPRICYGRTRKGFRQTAAR